MSALYVTVKFLGKFVQITPFIRDEEMGWLRGSYPVALLECRSDPLGDAAKYLWGVYVRGSGPVLGEYKINTASNSATLTKTLKTHVHMSKEELSMKSLCCGIDLTDDVKFIPYRADLGSNGDIGINEKSIQVSKRADLPEFSAALTGAFALCENNRPQRSRAPQ